MPMETLSDHDRLKAILEMISKVNLPDDGTWEDMYFQLEGTLQRTFRRIRTIAIYGELPKADDE